MKTQFVRVRVVAVAFNTLEIPYNKSWFKVWVGFDKFEEDGKQVAKCKHFPKVLTRSSKNGTTHLKVCPGKKNQNQENQSHLDVLKMDIIHQHPLDLAGQEAFKNFEKKREVRQGFDKLACKFNFRVSLWKNGLDDEWKLKMKILSFKILKHIYDTKALSEIIWKSVSEWNLETCVRDQGSLSSTHWIISCSFLENGYHEMYSILHKFWESIEHVTETTHGRLKFQEVVDQLESGFDILVGALKSREIFCQLEQVDGNFKLNPSMEEWENAIALKSCLKLIYCHDNVYCEYTNGARNLIASTSILDDSNSLTTETANDCESELALPLNGDILVSMTCSVVSTMIMPSSYSDLDPNIMEALICNQNWLENLKETNSTKDIAKDSNNNNNVKSCKNQCYRETGSGNKSKSSNKMLLNTKLNFGRNNNDVIEILSEDTSLDNNQLYQIQSSYFISLDVKSYLLSRFTSKDHKQLDKWQRNELNEFKLMGNEFAHLFMVPQDDETQKKYYINDSVIVNAFFELLKKRSESFPNAYINHYSFSSHLATQLIEGFKSEHEVLTWFKAEKLTGEQKLRIGFKLWKKISRLDPYPSSQILSYRFKKLVKVLQCFKSFLLPMMQMNGHLYSVDCGVFVMKYSDCLTHGKCFPFKQEMDHFCRRIFLDIYRENYIEKINKD
ncbi:hypothetical protein ES288_D01G192500v1 [Gossypium darwinii]|uniref:Ubiquitin-like protease family profile domain-containing protein n=1 Tax=Gossypium darwinii TaxID=34276 RepID=A0A5D2DRF3_GOSDA|nr:hypothetical protein ES288_D01G192500v1 [Gossypium darwinii]